jgi:hypothetical protein
LLLGGVIHYSEELTLQARVGWSGDVFAISPLSVTASTSNTSTPGSRVAVCVLAEATLGPIPATLTTATRGEVGGVGIGPVATRARAITCETVRSACQEKSVLSKSKSSACVRR